MPSNPSHTAPWEAPDRALGLRDGAYDRHKANFSINAVRPPIGIQTRGRPWRTLGGHLTDKRLVSHLERHYAVAVGKRVYSLWIAFDLDVHNGETRKDLERRYQEIRGVFPHVAPLVFSSPRDGLHVYFLLDEPTWTDRAVAYAHDELRKVGIELRSGSVEMYPNGGRLFRLPMGPGSDLLDPYKLTVVNRGLYSLAELLEADEVERLSVPKHYRPTVAPAGSRPRRRRSGSSPSAFMSRVASHLEVGLTGPGQSNNAILDMSWWARGVCGWDEERAAGELWTWFQGAHGGHSRDYNASPNAVHRQIESAVSCFDQRRIQRRSAPDSDLAQCITAHVATLSMEPEHREFLYELLVYVHARGEEIEPGYLDAEIPSETLRRCWNRSYGPVLRHLIEAKHVQQIGNHSTLLHRCNRYRVPQLFIQEKVP